MLILKHKTRRGGDPALRATFLSVGPESTGYPPKNAKRLHKKPLPPCEKAGGRQGGGLGWVGWVGWVGWAGWAGWAGGLAGLAGLGRCKVYGDG